MNYKATTSYFVGIAVLSAMYLSAEEPTVESERVHISEDGGAIIIQSEAIPLWTEDHLERATNVLDEAAKTFAELYADRVKISNPEDLPERIKAIIDHSPGLVRSFHSNDPNRAYLGISIYDSERGIEVVSVSTSSEDPNPLQQGDVILSINGVALTQENRDDSKTGHKVIQEVLQDFQPGDYVDLIVLRDGENVARTVKTVSQNETWDIRPEVARVLKLDGDLWNTLSNVPWDDGWDSSKERSALYNNALSKQRMLSRKLQMLEADGELASYFGIDSGIVVLNNEYQNELKDGDVILSLGTIPISSKAQVYDILQHIKQPIAAEVLRKSQRVQIEIPPLSEG